MPEAPPAAGAAAAAAAAAAAPGGRRKKKGGQGEGGDPWEGHKHGFDWQLERARRTLEGPAFAPFRMDYWKPPAVRACVRAVCVLTCLLACLPARALFGVYVSNVIDKTTLTDPNIHVTRRAATPRWSGA